MSHSFDGIPAGSMCTVTETADGATVTISATVSGNDQKVTVPAGKVVPVNVMDVYQGTVGSLKVTKTIAGGNAAHQHGPIAILVDCGGPLNAYAFQIPAHATGSVSRYFNGLPAGSSCTVTETQDGHTGEVAVVTSGKSQKVTIHANRSATVHITDRFHPKPKPAPVGHPKPKPKPKPAPVGHPKPKPKPAPVAHSHPKPKRPPVPRVTG